eukprot:357377-Chlamydomonas_euryale.AAC.3
MQQAERRGWKGWTNLCKLRRGRCHCRRLVGHHAHLCAAGGRAASATTQPSNAAIAAVAAAAAPAATASTAAAACGFHQQPSSRALCRTRAVRAGRVRRQQQHAARIAAPSAEQLVAGTCARHGA